MLLVSKLFKVLVLLVLSVVLLCIEVQVAHRFATYLVVKVEIKAAPRCVTSVFSVKIKANPPLAAGVFTVEAVLSPPFLPPPFIEVQSNHSTSPRLGAPSRHLRREARHTDELHGFRKSQHHRMVFVDPHRMLCAPLQAGVSSLGLAWEPVGCASCTQWAPEAVAELALGTEPTSLPELRRGRWWRERRINFVVTDNA